MLLTTLVVMAAENPLAAIEEARGERFTYFAGERRDPFLFRREFRKPIFRPEPNIPDKPPVIVPIPEPGIDPEPARLIEQAEKALRAGDYERAKDLAKQAKGKVTEGHPAALRQIIERDRRALAILMKRKHTEEEFRRLPLRVEAIMWIPDEPVAVINGRTHREGDVLDDRVVVHRIGKGEVVFLFKESFKFRKRLDWSKD